MVAGQHIVALAERYSSLVSIGLKMASSPALADGKVLPRLRARFAASITMTLAERAWERFAKHPFIDAATTNIAELFGEADGAVRRWIVAGASRLLGRTDIYVSPEMDEAEARR